MRRKTRIFLAALFLLPLTLGSPPPLDAQDSGTRYFAETKQSVRGSFLKYWTDRGGLVQQGFPISAEMEERSDLNGKTYTVQYFERAVFEWHPENQPPYDVLLTQLGTLRYRQKYPNEASGQRPNNDPGTVLFPETGKRLGGSFLTYWRSQGGLPQHGYPISDEMTERSDLNGKTYTVQYFERAMFEWHPDNQPPYNVLLSQLGTFRHRQKYPSAAPSPPPPSPGGREWITPVNISRSPAYDNVPEISVTNGELFVGWEQRDEGAGANNTMVATFRDPPDAVRAVSLQTTGFKQTGGVKVRRDLLGRRHVIWWGQTGSTVCNYYARVEVDGRLGVQETVPGTCGRQQKLTALSIGPDSSAHAIFGRDNTAVYYYQRREDGQWPVQAETITTSGQPTGVAIVATTGGTVMAAYRTGLSASASDIFAGTRQGDGKWAMENISASCCTGCPGTSHSYNPTFAADPGGGIRLLWADEQCEPRTVPRQNDLYYREWQPGRGWTGPFVRAVQDPGDAFENSMVVDEYGVAHIVFASDLGVERHGEYRLYYVSGKGSAFSAPVRVRQGWATIATFHKSPTLAYADGWLHLVFNSDHERNKEVYYSNKQIYVR